MPSVSWKKLSWWIAGLALMATLAAPDIARTNAAASPAQDEMLEAHLTSR